MKSLLTAMLILSCLCTKAQSSIIQTTLNPFRQISDTAFYESGKIRTLTISKNEKRSSFLSDENGRLIRIIYQYDECSNLRSTTNFYSVYIDSRYYCLLTQSPGRKEEIMVDNVYCDKPWVKEFALPSFPTNRFAYLNIYLKQTDLPPTKVFAQILDR